MNFVIELSVARPNAGIWTLKNDAVDCPTEGSNWADFI